MRAVDRLITGQNISVDKTNQPALIFIFGVALLDLLGLTLLIPVTPYIVRQYSSQAVMVTLMTVLYAGAQFAAAPLLGRLSDRYGRRPVLLVCIFGSALGYVLFGIGGALWVLFLARLIDGFTGGNISIAMAYIADVAPCEMRAKYFGLLGATFGASFILGPVIGGGLGQVHVNAPAFAAGALSLAGAGLGLFILPESLPPEKRNHDALRWAEVNPFSAIGEQLRRPELAGLLLAQALFNFIVTGFNSLAAVFFIQAFGASPLQISGVLVAAGITNIIMQAGLIERLVRRFGERRLAALGIFFQAVQVAGTALVPSLWVMYLFQGLASGGSGPARPSLSALLANRVSPQEQGKLNGVSTSLNSLMSVFGPLAAGLAYDHITPAAPFWIGGILLCLVAGLVLKE